MHLESPKNPNYCATVCELGAFAELAGCDNLKAAIIFGNSVIVSKDTPAGAVGLFFPVETQLTRDFLANNNLFRKPEWGNADAAKKGFFEEHGRVKAVKFRGHKSEGFWIPLASLEYLGIALSEFPVGSGFDCVGDRVICKKYVPHFRSHVGSGQKAARLARVEDRIVDGQFRFHPDTENLRRNIHKITPDMWISISDKWHGTSVVIANILVQRDLTWFERLLRRFGVKIQDREYGLTWSSRRVVKGVNGESKETAQHFYTEDIWGVVAREVAARIPKGITIYGEIVGFTADGAAIQQNYHYGCNPGTHRLLVYRVTSTNADGNVTEFPWQQIKVFCEKYGFEMVRELWYGRAGDFVQVNASDWQSNFLAALEQGYVDDRMCPHNRLQVPAEGVVLKVDRLEDGEAYKLKNWKFLEHETKMLDKGEADIETQESDDTGAEEPSAA